jgi:hypothetical protein
MDLFGIGGVAQAGASLASAALAAKAQKDIAEKNIKAQEQANALNAALARENMAGTTTENNTKRDFALRTLDMSKPDLSSKELSDLLFSQGEQGFNEQSDRGLAMTLRRNMRTGSPLSSADIAAKFNERAAAARGDRRSESQLKGILGVLPGAAAQQSAASLYGSTQTPQNTFQSQPIQTPYTPGAGELLGLAGYQIPGLLQAFSGNNNYDTQLRNSNPGAATGGANSGIGFSGNH